jgi:multiple sugar transport system permease protein
MKLHRKNTGSILLVNVLAYIILILTLIPVLWMFITSIKPKATPVNIISILLSPPFTLENFQYVIQNAPILIWLLNSLYIALAVTLVVLTITSLAAYSFSQLKFPGHTIIFSIVIAGLMVPIEVTIIPLFLTMLEQRLINTHLGVMLPGFAAPLGVLILKNYYDSVPKELAEAATIDGAGSARIFFNVFVPLSRSSLAAVGIFTFISSWNNFLWPFISITNKNLMTVPVGLPMFQGAYAMELCIPMAASMIASAPAILMFIFLQKHIIKGIAMTGIKG